MKLNWRKATSDDLPRLRELQAENDALEGKAMDLPHPADRHMLIYLVAVDEDGIVQGAMYHEKCVEMCFVGRDPRVTAMVIRDSEVLFDIARRNGIKFIHCSVPKLDEMRPANEGLSSTGFNYINDEYSHFVKDLR